MNPKNHNPVGLFKRLVVMFYDAILLIAVLFFASIVFVVPLDIKYGDPLYPLYIIYIYSVGFLYLGWCWTHGGQTLGLKTWKLKLASRTGNEVSWREAFLRYFASLLCWLSLGIGFLWCYTNKERLAWNDLLSKTSLQRTVIKKPSE
jgi:uncharacterized RDD family membrane protein YckC